MKSNKFNSINDERQTSNRFDSVFFRNFSNEKKNFFKLDLSIDIEMRND